MVCDKCFHEVSSTGAWSEDGDTDIFCERCVDFVGGIKPTMYTKFCKWVIKIMKCLGERNV